ncbi:MAG TPA: immunoglobulin domain-containing protein [Verrucomicrobiae bacterium]|nr:immunoglobulin domain-containing protein [Verrucomicrobiae bacterium]
MSAGDTVTFSVVATSSAPLSYQWQKGNVTIPGQNSPTLILSSVTSNDAAQYSVVVSNQLGFVTSAPAALTVTAGASLQLTISAPGLLNLQGDTGVSWQIQSRDSLATGAWLPLSNVLLDLSPKSFTDPNSLSKSNRFYRAQKIP